MKKYIVLRTDLADEQIRQMIDFAKKRFGVDTALARLDEYAKARELLETNPYIGMQPRYRILKKQGFRVLVLEKDLLFYKVHEKEKKIIIYAVVDQRQDYLDIINGL